MDWTTLKVPLKTEALLWLNIIGNLDPSASLERRLYYRVGGWEFIKMQILPRVFGL